MRRVRTAVAMMTLGAAATALAACEGAGFGRILVPTDTGGQGAQVVSIDVSPDSLRLESVGASGQLSATPLDASGQALPGAPVTWSSSAPAVASVTGSGLVTALSEGRAAITATSGGAQASALVSVGLSGGS